MLSAVPCAYMRLSCNMATGKGLAAILRPKTINLIGSNKLSKFPHGVLRQCDGCQRHVMTVASTVGGWNREKSKVDPSCVEPLCITSFPFFQRDFVPGAFAGVSIIFSPGTSMFPSSAARLSIRYAFSVGQHAPRAAVFFLCT